MSPTRVILTLLLVSLWGCGKVVVGVHRSVSVPKDSQQQCRSHCESIGMSLGAVAIMASNVGCVCEPAGASGGQAASITAGMATIAMQVQQQQQQQQPAGR